VPGKTNKDGRADDGCNYMTPEELAEFGKNVAPVAFDSSDVKNKILNVKYGKLPEHLLDIYLPESGDGPFPLVIYVHGGGWRMGSKTESFMESTSMAAAGGWAARRKASWEALSGCSTTGTL